MDRKLKTTKPNPFLLWVTIFLIPTNLFLTFAKDSAYISGILVDYLIPKLHLLDISLILLTAPWLIANRKILPTKLKRTITQNKLLAVLILASSILAPNPLVSFWHLAKLGLMLLFYHWLTTNFTTNPRQTTRIHLSKLTWPLALTTIFQFLVGTIQWVQRRSLLGYYFFGESTLNTSSHIAKTVIAGQIRPLAYGTTPHPNVLAGFTVLSTLIILTLRKKPPSRIIHNSRFTIHTNSLFHHLLLAIPIITLAFTQSLSALLALLAGLVLYRFPQTTKRLWFPMLGILLALALFLANFAESESVTRRLALTKIASQIIIHKPFLGTGPANFTAVIEDYGSIPGTTRFFQPVHNIFLLAISEFGLLISLLIFVQIIENRRSILATLSKSAHLLIPLLILTNLDHYPLTLNTGILISVLTLATANLNKN